MRDGHLRISINFEEMFLLKFMFYKVFKDRKIYEKTILNFLSKLEQMRYVVQVYETMILYEDDASYKKDLKKRLYWELENDSRFNTHYL